MKEMDTVDTREIIKMAAEIGAKTALETIEHEKQRELRAIADHRLHNTKLLLRNYRLLQAHAANAVYRVEEYESPETILSELMMPRQDGNMFVESIKKSAARTATIVKHMETMMQLYRTYCFTTGSAEDERRWRVINALYICDKGERRSVPQLAKDEGVVERTIYKDVDVACERIAALMFGIDGVKRK